eukprot:8680746-Pyramimonas_sp.AAC.1
MALVVRTFAISQWFVAWRANTSADLYFSRGIVALTARSYSIEDACGEPQVWKGKALVVDIIWESRSTDVEF